LGIDDESGHKAVMQGADVADGVPAIGGVAVVRISLRIDAIYVAPRSSVAPPR
jgi:hypothetical protein